MSATEEAVAEEGPRGPTLLDNPHDAVAEILSKREAPSAQPETASPAEPAAPVANWRELVLDGDDVPEFIRGKKGSDVVTSWKHAQATLKEAQQRAADSAKEAEQLRRDREADQAALRTQQRPAQPEPAQTVGDDEEFVFTAAEIRKLVQEGATEEIRKYSEATTAGEQIKTWKQQGMDAFTAAQKALGLDDATWEKRARSVMYALTDPNDRWAAQGGPLVTKHYLDVYKDLFGDLPTQAAPATPVTPVPKAPNPPGSKSVTVTQHERALPTVSGEKALAAESIARAMGLSPENAGRLLNRKENNR